MPFFRSPSKPLEYRYLIDNIENFFKKELREQLKFIDAVVESHAIFGINTNIATEVFRVRNIDKGVIVKEFRDVLWAPKAYNINNRFGDYCYVSSYPFVALSETENENRDTVALSAFKMKDGEFTTLLPIGELNNISRYGIGHALINEDHELRALRDYVTNLEKNDREQCLCLILQESFLFNMLSGDNRDLSQYTIGKLLNECGHDVKIIGYPSFSVQGGYNFAINTDTFLDLFKFHFIKNCKVERLPYNLYRCHPLEHVTSINDQDLIWTAHSGNDDIDIILGESVPS